MFWDGIKWVDERKAAPTAAPAPRRRARDVVATMPIVLLLPVLLLPLMSAGASGFAASLSISGTAVPGSAVTVTGSGFEAREWVDVRWDGTSTGMVVRADSGNSFSAQLTIPSGAAGGTHEVSAHATSKYGKGRDAAPAGSMLASAIVNVSTGAATPPPTVGPSPTATPTPNPTSTAAPTATPSGASIVSVSATSLGQTTATIVWTVSAPATGQVEYGKTTAYGSLSIPELSYTWSTHVQTLSGLTPGTLYNYRVRSTTNGGVNLVSGNYTFSTLGMTSSPTPAPTPSPTLAPSPTPSATPTPSGTRPFAAPTTSRTVNVPSTIDATGSVDVANAMNAFVASVPNGSIINFPSNATYRMSRGIYVRDRSDLIFRGNGTTIRAVGSGGSTDSSGFKLDNLNSDIAIHDFVVIGNNTNTTTIYNAGVEGQHGVKIADGRRIEINNVSVKNVHGDGVYVEGWNTSPYRPSDQIWIHDSSFDYIGRMGLVFNSAANSIAERNSYNHIGLFVFDIESDMDYERVENVYFRDNTVGSYGHSPLYTNYFFACSGNQAVAVVRNVYVTGNHVSIGAPINSPNNTSSKGGLASIVGRGNRLNNIVFRGNSTAKSGAGSVLQFQRIDGLTVTDNQQPLTSGSLAAIYDSTNVTYQP